LQGAPIRWIHGEAETILERQDSGAFSCVFLGDLLSDPERREPLLRALLRVLRPGARVLWWGNRAPCPVPDSLRGQLEERPDPWILQDRALLRASVHLAIRS
jgi:hypothetical protein